MKICLQGKPLFCTFSPGLNSLLIIKQNVLIPEESI
jgi:hypothetical protein